MSGFMSYFGGRKDSKQVTRDAIVGLREQLVMLEKKEEYLIKKIEEELKKAKSNAVSNKALATAALRRKKNMEAELDRIGGTRLQLETQINTLESANINAETLAAMKRGSEALRHIHGRIRVTDVEAQMDSIREQGEIANEISEAIAGDANVLEDEELRQELAELEQEELDERLMGAERVPIHTPASPVRNQATKQPMTDLDEEERQLKELQAQLAM